MGFFFKGIKNNRLLFKVRGKDILYALQFPECKWDYNVCIELPQCYFDFRRGIEYFLLIDKNCIKCVWEYDDFVPNYVKQINTNKIYDNINLLGKTEEDVNKEISKYTQPEFPIDIWCKHGDKSCKSWVHPYWTNLFSERLSQDLSIPKRPYLCNQCLENPPRVKKTQLPTPLAIMQLIYD